MGLSAIKVIQDCAKLSHRAVIVAGAVKRSVSGYSLVVHGDPQETISSAISDKTIVLFDIQPSIPS